MFKRILIILLLTGRMVIVWAQPGENPDRIQASPSVQKSGILPDELDARIKMITNRIAFGEDPKLTEDFIVACVTLDPKFDRRFTEFSGDQCGRYLSAFSSLQIPENPVDIREVARKIILTQKADGRFGNDHLNFDDLMKLEGNHMALLWGNGRLLTGLMDYYVASKDPAVLQSAIKLGNFLLKTARSCMQKSVVERFKTMGAMGYICFTQITDGMVKLYQQTSDKKYLQSASAIYPLLPPLGNQHSHGFLNTLLGVMHLYSATHDLQHLAYVEKIYAQVLEAPDFLISGGVPEFFNAEGTKPGSRDEGCSEADFIMVSLELWKATGNVKYLDRAEYCLYNELMYNQFESGDFGSHPIGKNFGFEVATSPGRCWWCCDYHGLQAMLEARKIIVTNHNGEKLVNLFAHTNYRDSDMAFTLSKISARSSSYTLRIDSCRNVAEPIAIRIPSWATEISLTLNGKKIDGKKENGYLLVERVWTKSDKLQIDLIYRLKLITSDKQIFSITNMPATLKKTSLQYGPYLLSADDGFNTSFLAEPAGRNVIYLSEKAIQPTASAFKMVPASNLLDGYLKMEYRHEGYYAPGTVILRPMSEVTYGHQSNVQLYFNFEKK